jgi:hypothetical protein
MRSAVTLLRGATTATDGGRDFESLRQRFPASRRHVIDRDRQCVRACAEIAVVLRFVPAADYVCGETPGDCDLATPMREGFWQKRAR